MRIYIRYIIARILILLGFVKRENNRVHSENLITSIYFHNPSKELFEKSVKWLKKHKFHFISVDELHSILTENKQVLKGSVCLTVDDGRIGNLDSIIPVVKKYNIPITIFIPTKVAETGVFWWSYIQKHNKTNMNKISLSKSKDLPNKERVELINELAQKIELEREIMTKEDVINISKLEQVTIGNHTVNHPITIRCTEEELKHEIIEASNELKSWINKDIEYFAYPNGDFDGREEKILRDLNYKIAFTTEPDFINPKANINLFEVPRFCVNDNGSFSENICKMVGVWQKHIK